MKRAGIIFWQGLLTAMFIIILSSCGNPSLKDTSIQIPPSPTSSTPANSLALTNTPKPTNTPIPSIIPEPRLSIEQINDDGFGDPANWSVFAVEEFNGMIFAGTRNNLEGAEIWMYDQHSWEQVIDNGFGDPVNNAVYDFIVFDGYLYAGIYSNASLEQHSKAAEIWRTVDGTNWERVVENGFEQGPRIPVIANFVTFGDFIFAITSQFDGIEIWRSKTGSKGDWSPVVLGGFGNPNNIAALASAKYHDTLYLGTYTEDGTAEIYVTKDGENWDLLCAAVINGITHLNVSSIFEFQEYLYFTMVNKGSHIEKITRVYRCKECLGNDWEMVFDGPYTNPGMYRKPSLIEYENQLYLLVGNTTPSDNDPGGTTGFELWRTNNGMTWSRVDEIGFGDNKNAYTLWESGMIVFKDSLYIGLDNRFTGGEIWRLSE